MTVASNRFRFVKSLDAGLVVISRVGANAMWSKGTLRKVRHCAATGVRLPAGTAAYRPVGNMQYRAERLSVAFVENHLDGEGKHP
jgi:hypothetical protein